MSFISRILAPSPKTLRQRAESRALKSRSGRMEALRLGLYTRMSIDALRIPTLRPSRNCVKQRFVLDQLRFTVMTCPKSEVGLVMIVVREKREHIGTLALNAVRGKPTLVLPPDTDHTQIDAGVEKLFRALEALSEQDIQARQIRLIEARASLRQAA
jgi:hypothetical protein